jgi:hypothetical protein
MSNLLAPLTKQQFFLNSGAFNAGGLVYTYAAGTSSPIATYNATGALNPNPVVLDSRGSADIWMLPNVGYKLLVTDPSGNTLSGYPIDNIYNSQLITLYGGVDTGAANAYVLNFVAPYTSYSDGIVIYWIPANGNTGPSTINVNSLGAVGLVGINGAPLIAAAIVANQPAVILSRNAQFYVIQSGTQAFATYGSFTGTSTGFVSPLSPTIYWTQIANLVTLTMPVPMSGISNATTTTITGVPSTLMPLRSSANGLCSVTDNGTTSLNPGTVSLAAGATTLVFAFDAAGDPFTAAGLKSINSFQLTYPLS